MSRAPLSLVFLTCCVAFGCAGNPANVAGNSTAAPATAPATLAEGGGAPTVVDGNQLAARAAQTPICRDVLRRNSNVHVMECRTAEQWKAHQRAEAQAAGDIARQLQGSGFRR
jgi:hypothetical protein